jgi:hypothetical protein
MTTYTGLNPVGLAEQLLDLTKRMYGYEGVPAALDPISFYNAKSEVQKLADALLVHVFGPARYTAMIASKLMSLPTKGL